MQRNSHFLFFALFRLSLLCHVVLLAVLELPSEDVISLPRSIIVQLNSPSKEKQSPDRQKLSVDQPDPQLVEKAQETERVNKTELTHSQPNGQDVDMGNVISDHKPSISKRALIGLRKLAVESAKSFTESKTETEKLFQENETWKNLRGSQATRFSTRTDGQGFQTSLVGDRCFQQRGDPLKPDTWLWYRVPKELCGHLR